MCFCVVCKEGEGSPFHAIMGLLSTQIKEGSHLKVLNGSLAEGLRLEVKGSNIKVLEIS